MTPSSPRPNVLVVIADDLAFGDLACHGNPHTATPHLDTLHAQSARLTRYCSGPLCTPARAALMTGRHPYRTGAFDTYLGRSTLDPNERTLPQVLGAAGYATGLFGKWHLGDTLPSRPHDLGFDQALYHTGGGLRQPANVGRDSYFDPDLIRNGSRETSRGYCTDVFTDAALDFIDQKQTEPWFCYLATNAPHSPFEVPEQWVQPYRDAGLTEKLARLYGMIANLDANIGRLLERLDTLGLADDTIVIFTSDHGPCPSAVIHGQIRHNADLRGMKGTMYEGGIRVPNFWRWPSRFPAGRDIDRLANPIDVLPTLAPLCQGAVPDDRAIDGQDLTPLLTGETDNRAWPDRAIAMQWHRGDVPQRYHNAAVLGQRFKWYWPADAERAELYDLHTDPREQHDLADAKPELVSEMQAQYEQWFDDVCTTRGNTPEENAAPVPILIGDDRDNPTVLTRQDGRLLEGMPEGWDDEHLCGWSVDVTRPGRYRITLDLPELDASGTVAAQCGPWSAQVPVEPRCPSVGFDDAALPTGHHRFEAVLQGPQGQRLAARYVHIQRLGD